MLLTIVARLLHVAQRFCLPPELFARADLAASVPLFLFGEDRETREQPPSLVTLKLAIVRAACVCVSFL